MLTFPRRPISLAVCTLLLICVFFSSLPPVPVRADVGVQPILPVGSSLKPGDKKTPIQMAAEVVTLNVRQATKADNDLVKLNPVAYGYELHPVWYPGIAEVTADFTMKNPTRQAVKMTVWFPLASALKNQSWELNPDEIVPYIRDFQVEVDGKRVNHQVTVLPNPKGAGKPPLPWASFPVTFPPGKKTNIYVSYMLPLQPEPKQPVMQVNYIFQTGAGWAGPIGQAKLVLNLPYPASVETMTKAPYGAKLEGKRATWIWKNFEPGPLNDFYVGLLNPGRWQELEAARAAVKKKPKDGQAWLDLAAVYRNLSLNIFTFSYMHFGPTYIPLGIDAYRKSVELLPDHPVSHAGLALLTLAKYRHDKSTDPAVLQFVRDEYELAKELDAKDPSLLKAAGSSRYILDWLEEALALYPG